MSRPSTPRDSGIPLDQIHAEGNIRTFRTDDEPFRELLGSVKAKGVLEPVLLRPIAPGRANGCRYELVAGFRRYSAACEAGLARIPARVLEDLTDADVLEVRLIENLHREGMNAVDEALALRELHDRGALSNAAIGVKIGKSEGWVAGRIGLLRLPEEVQQRIRDGRLRPGHAALLVPYADRPAEQLVKLAQLGGRLTSAAMGVLVEQAASARTVRTWPTSDSCTCSCGCCAARGSHERVA